jgi:threonyl-tRNA synthetase
LEQNGIRSSADLRNEKISYKIREHSLQKTPYLLIIGDKEVENKTVTVRERANRDQKTMPLDNFTSSVKEKIAKKI